MFFIRSYDQAFTDFFSCIQEREAAYEESAVTGTETIVRCVFPFPKLF